MAKKTKERTLADLWEMAKVLNERVKLPADPVLDGGVGSLSALQSHVLTWRRQANELAAIALRKRAEIKRAHGWALRCKKRQESIYWVAPDDELVGQTATKKGHIIKHRMRDDLDEIENLDGDRRDWEGFLEFVREVIKSITECKELLRQQTDVALVDRTSAGPS